MENTPAYGSPIKKTNTLTVKEKCVLINTLSGLLMENPYIADDSGVSTPVFEPTFDNIDRGIIRQKIMNIVKSLE